MDNKKMSTPMERRTQMIQEEYTPFLGGLSSDSQKRMVMEHLMEHRSITQEEAWDRYRISRLAPRVSELRDMGANIVTIMEDNRYNTGQHARYFLEGKE